MTDSTADPSNLDNQPKREPFLTLKVDRRDLKCQDEWNNSNCFLTAEADLNIPIVDDGNWTYYKTYS